MFHVKQTVIQANRWSWLHDRDHELGKVVLIPAGLAKNGPSSIASSNALEERSFLWNSYTPRKLGRCRRNFFRHEKSVAVVYGGSNP